MFHRYAFVAKKNLMRFSGKRIGLVLLLALFVLATGAFWYLRGRNSPPISNNGGTPFTNFTATLMLVSSYGSDIYAVRIVEPGNSQQIGR